MKLIQITVEKAYTINLGNFESAKLGASAVAELEDGDDPDEVYEEVAAFLEDRLSAEMEALKPA